MNDTGNKFCAVPMTSQSPAYSTLPPLKTKCLGLKAGPSCVLWWSIAPTPRQGPGKIPCKNVNCLPLILYLDKLNSGPSQGMHTIYLYCFTLPQPNGMLDSSLTNSGNLQASLKKRKDEREIHWHQSCVGGEKQLTKSTSQHSLPGCLGHSSLRWWNIWEQMTTTRLGCCVTSAVESQGFNHCFWTYEDLWLPFSYYCGPSV